MPLYEYTCRHCHERIEILQRMGEGPDGLACLVCGRETLEKQLSTFSARAGGNGRNAAAAGCAPGRFT